MSTLIRALKLILFYSLMYPFSTAAQPSVSFLAPDTVCVDEPITITNQTTGGSRYFWSFCSGNLSSPPTSTNLGNFAGNIDLPVFMDYAYSNGNYYGFVVNHRNGRLTRLNFGNSLLNNPTTVTIQLPAGVLPATDGAEDIQVIQNEGKWYAIMVAGYPPTGYSPRLIKIEFGANIENTNPTATDWGNIGNLLQPIGFHMFQDGANWYGFTVNAENNSITRFSFTNSFDNIPTAVNLGNIGNLSYPTSIYAINDNGSWKVFVLNAGNNTTTSGNFSISRLDFGNSLLNNPIGLNLGNPNGVLKHPRDFTILKSCGETIGFAVNGMPSTYDLVRLDFNNDLNAIPDGTSIGNIGQFSFPHSISKIFRTGESLYAFVTNVQNNTISRIQFSGCTDASIPSSTDYAPPTFSYSRPGTYTVSLLVDEGLSTQAAFCKTITVLPPPENFLPPDSIQCELGTIQIRALEENGIEYNWSNGTTTIETAISSTGKYWLDMVSSAGCSASDTINIEINPSPVFAFGADTSICNGSEFILNAPQAGDGYSWNDGSSTESITVRAAGLYFLTLQNGQCNHTDTLEVLPLPAVNIDLGVDQILCKDENKVLIADQIGYPNYIWSTGATSQNISINQAGWYWVEATNSSDCIARDSILISDAIPVPVDLGHDLIACSPASITLAAPAGADVYTWNNGASTNEIIISEAGEYFVDVYKDGCLYSDTLLITLNPTPELIVSPDTSICINEEIELTASASAGSITWNTGSTGTSISIIDPGIYTAIATHNNCSTQQNIIVNRAPLPTLSVGPDLAFCEGQVIQLSAEVANGNFLQWSDGTPTLTRTINGVGTYIATAENRCSTVEDTLQVVPGSGKETSYQLANAFTPNGDGVNDCFGIKNWIIKDLHEFSIYNRFGQLIFKGNNANRCWDGYFNGTLQENGGYVYVLRAETYCGSITKKGIFLLIK